MANHNSLRALEGTLERLTYHNEETGYTVARLTPLGKFYEVTVVGALAGISVGESLRLQGTWITHPRYGRQFEIQSYTVKLPATIEGIRKYLGSGLVKGVGPVNAARIVDFYGLQTLEIIEQDVERLREVPGVGPKRAKRIAEAWEEQKQIKEIMLFLQSHGISTSLAVRIYRQYAEEAASIVQHYPYRLAKEVRGIGFKTADKIAQQMGMPSDAPERVQAGLSYALGAFSDDGHCFAAREALIATASDLLEVESGKCEVALEAMLQAEDIVIVRSDSIPDGTGIYLPPFYYAELGVANKIHQLQQSNRDRLTSFRDVAWETVFDWLAQRSSLRLAPEQETAIRMALTERVSILTGGPGTGKSTILGSLIELLRTKQKRVLLAAPTGRAAKRLNETTGLPAKTIHRLLEFKPGLGNAFLRDRDNPLDADLIIVDEVSMIDILLMNQLLKAVEAGTHLLLVGDADQLPSVGAGNVLHDLIESNALPVTRLQTIFRQAEESNIVVNAHRINRGELPLFGQGIPDFFFFQQPDPEQAAELLVDIVARRIPSKFGLDPTSDIQVLSPMHRGDCGVAALNTRLQTRLNPASDARPALMHGTSTYRVGDRVMQTRNAYERQVFNGDMGIVTHIDLEEQLVAVGFDGVDATYETTQLDELVHAYAVSIHKSQGSEFPAVVIPILTQHYVMLQRNLLYTAVTRARDLVVLVGDRRAIAIAVRNNRTTRRNTGLAERLMLHESPKEEDAAGLTYQR